MRDIPFYSCKPRRTELRKIENRVRKILKSGNYVGGRALEDFEAQFADYLGVQHFIGVGNGLDALTLTLMALDVGPGDEVIVPSFSFIATWSCVARVGASAVPVDVDPESGLMAEGKVLEAVTPRTRAIIPVHLYGAICDLSGIRAELGRAGIHLIEDCAQSAGASNGAKRAGSLGIAGAFSFYPTKNLGAFGDGGGISTQDADLAARIRSIRSYGFSESRYKFRELGVNSRLDPLQAVILSTKLETLDQNNDYRRWQASQYRRALEGTKVEPLQKDSGSVFHHFAVRVPNRETFKEALMGEGINSDSHYEYTFNQFNELLENPLSVPNSATASAEVLARTVATLPIGNWLSRGQTMRVANALEKVANKV